MLKTLLRSLLVTAALVVALFATLPLHAQSGPAPAPANGDNATLLSVTPDDGTTNIDPNTDFTLTFETDVLPATGSISIVRVSDETTIETIPVTSAQVTVDGAVVTVNPTPLLNFSDSYRVEYPSSAFVVNLPLQLVETSPGAGAINVDFTQPVIVTFNQAADVAVSGVHILCGPTLSFQDLTEVAVSPTLPQNGVSSITFIPDDGTLPPGARCRILIDKNLITASDDNTLLDDQGGANDNGVIFINIETIPDAVDDTYPETLLGNVSVDSSAVGFQVFINEAESVQEVEIAADSTSVCGGAVTFDTDTGQFLFDPPVGYEGEDSFTYTITTAGPNSRGSSATATVAFTIKDMIWFIDNNDTLGLNLGTLSNPYQETRFFNERNTLEGLQVADAPGCPGAGTEVITPQVNDTVFIYGSETDYVGFTEGNDGLLVRNRQTIIGQGTDDGTLAELARRGKGVTIPASGADLPETDGLTPTISGEGEIITIAKDNHLVGFDLRLDNLEDIGLGGTDFQTLYVSDLNITNDTLATSLGRFLQLKNGSFVEGSNIGTLQSSLHPASEATVLFEEVGGELTVATTTIDMAVDFAIGLQIQDSVGGTATVFDFGELNIRQAATGGLGILAFGNGDATLRNTSVGNTAITTTDGAALQILDTDIILEFDTINTEGSAADGIGIFDSGGSLTVGTTTIRNPNEDGIQVVNSDPSPGNWDFGDVTIETAAEGGAGVQVEDNGDKIVIINMGSTVSSEGGPAVDIMNTTVDFDFASLFSQFSNNSALLINRMGGTFNVVGQTQLYNAATNVLSIQNMSISDAVVTIGDVDIDAAQDGDGININGIFGPQVTIGNVTVDGVPNDGVEVVGVSSGSVTFGDTVIGEVGQNSTIGEDGVEISGMEGGTVTFASLDVRTINGDAFKAFDNPNGNLRVTNGTGALEATNGACVDINNPNGGTTDVSMVFRRCDTTNAPRHGLRLADTTGSLFRINAITNIDMVPVTSLEAVMVDNVATQQVDISAGSALTVTDRARTGFLIRNFGGTQGVFGNYTDANTANLGGGYGLRVESSTAPITFDAVNISNTQTLEAEERNDEFSYSFPITDGDGDGIFITENLNTVTINGGTIDDVDGEGIDHRNSAGLILNNVTVSNTNAHAIRMYRPLTSTSNFNNLTINIGNQFFSGFLFQQNTASNATVNIVDPQISNTGSADRGIWVRTYEAGGTSTINVSGSGDPRPGSGSTACRIGGFLSHSITLQAGADPTKDNTSSTLLGSVNQCRLNDPVDLLGGGGTNNTHTLDVAFEDNFLSGGRLTVQGSEGLTLVTSVQDNVINNNATNASVNFIVGGGSNADVTIIGNQVNGSGASGFNLATGNSATPSFCLDLQSNTASTGSGNDFRLVENNGDFRLVGPGTAVVTAANITGTLGNTAAGTGSVTIIGTPRFNGNTNCTLPTLSP
jgi:hypothetical protein